MGGFPPIFLYTMNLKKYIYLYLKEGNPAFRVFKGFTRENLPEVLNISENWQPDMNENHSLFFFPGCSVPRFKTRKIFSNTQTPKNATVAFISPDTLEGNTKSLIFHKCALQVTYSQIETFTKYMDKGDTFHSLVQNPHDGIYLDYQFWFVNRHTNYGFRSLSDHYPNIHNQRTSENHLLDSNQLFEIPKDSNLYDLKCDIFHEKEALAIVNADKTAISSEQYDMLREMGNSKNDENFSLMMSMMTNCDYEKSVMPLMFLIREFGAKMFEQPSSKHVGFRGMLSFFEIPREELKSIHISTITHIAKRFNIFTSTNMIKISMLYAKDYPNYPSAITAADGWQLGPINYKCEMPDDQNT